MNTSEELKKVVDTFGKLSFILETAVKLNQTGDCPEIASACLDQATTISYDLAQALDFLTRKDYGKA